MECLREKLKKRREEIEKLLNEQKDLCNDLEEPERPLPKNPLPSEQDMQGFRDHLELLRNEQFARFDRMMELRCEIEEVMAKLEISVLNEYDNKDLSCVEIKPIWQFLEISENYQKKFVEYTDHNQTTYLKHLAEIKQCEQKDNIKKLIEKVRDEIKSCWDMYLKSDADRLRFQSYTANVFNEDVLKLHKDELRDLKSFYKKNEAIFNIIRERQDLLNQMESLQNKESDLKRYNNRGGQLLKEEKERNMVAMKMPKIEAKLIEMVKKFESAHNRPLTMFGVPIEDVIERDYEAKRQEKLTKREERRSPSPNINGPEAKKPLLGAFASPSKAKVNGNGTGALKNPAIKITSPGDQGSE